jgi:hypothetical protein
MAFAVSAPTAETLCVHVVCMNHIRNMLRTVEI